MSRSSSDSDAPRRKDGTVALSLHEHVLVVEMRRPAARNALTPKMFDQLKGAFDSAHEEAKSLVLIGPEARSARCR